MKTASSIRRSLLLTTALGFLPSLSFADSIDPLSYSADINVGESVTIRKTVTVSDTPPSSGKLDVMFLIDTSGSMGSVINAAKTAATNILTTLSASFGDVATGVGYYSEPGSDGVYHDLTTDTSAAASNINSIYLGLGGGGGDFPEEGIHAIETAAAGASWRPGSKRVIVALGDANFKQSDGSTIASAQSAMASAGATFIGINYGGADCFSMRGTCAGGISAETFGTVFDSTGLNLSDLVDDITAGIGSAYASYSTVDLGLGDVPAGITASATCVGTCSGSFDRSTERTFTFDLTLTGDAVGTYDFPVYAMVDGAIVATETDHINVKSSVSVPEPGSVALMGLGLIGLWGARRRKA